MYLPLIGAPSFSFCIRSSILAGLGLLNLSESFVTSRVKCGIINCVFLSKVIFPET